MPDNIKIIGHVLTKENRGLEGKSVFLIAVNLKGASSYKTEKLFSKLEKCDGIKNIGKAETGVNGVFEYTVPFTDVKQWGAEFVELVAYVVEKDNIKGISNTTAISNIIRSGKCAGLRITLDEVEPEKDPEFTVIDSKVSACIAKYGVELKKLYDSPDQIRMVAEETGESVDKITLFVSANKFSQACNLKGAGPQLLYGLGRRNIGLSLGTFALTQTDRIIEAVHEAINDKIIPSVDDKTITGIITLLQKAADEEVVNKPESGIAAPLITNLKIAVTDKNLVSTFLKEYRNYKEKPDTFFRKRLPEISAFKKNSKAIQSIDTINTLASLTQNHTALIEELFKNQGVNDLKKLVAFSKDDWKKIITTTGAPASEKGKNDNERMESYSTRMYDKVNTTYPTEKIAHMVDTAVLPVKNDDIKKGITGFFENAPDFDIRSKRISDFDATLKQVSSDMTCDDLRKELCKIQRVHWLSPSPDLIPGLLERNLTSAYSIAGIPRQSFMKIHGDALGEETVEKVYAKATAISRATQMAFMTIYEMVSMAGPALTPSNIMASPRNFEMVRKVIPNWERLFGAPDICECTHAVSVLGPAAYLVDLLKYLNDISISDDESVLDVLLRRRGDIVYIPLTAENTDTEIPYIDLVNEILEFYTVFSIDDSPAPPDQTEECNAAEHTDDTTAPELRAQPQHTRIDAYKKLKDALYPFDLPYHQPLDAIRTCLTHFKTTRYELMNMVQKNTVSSTTELAAIEKAIDAERIGLSEMEYGILTGIDFTGSDVREEVWKYYGYEQETNDQGTSFYIDIANVPEFLSRTGMEYTDLVNLLKTRYINPHRTFTVLMGSFNLDVSHGSGSNIGRIRQADNSMSMSEFFEKCVEVKNGNLRIEDDRVFSELLDTHGIADDLFEEELRDTPIPDLFDGILLLYEENSLCNLETTCLKVLNFNARYLPVLVDVDGPRYMKLHRFIRLRRKTGWSIDELDRAIFSLGETGFTQRLIHKLANVLILMEKMPGCTLDQILCVCGTIPIGRNSLYEKYFCGSTQPAPDPVFEPDLSGNVLQGTCGTVGNHLTSILSGSGLKSDELHYMECSGNPVFSQNLNLQVLSLICAHSILKSFLGVDMAELCALIRIAGNDAYPFNQNGTIDPQKTVRFLEIADKIRQSEFSVPQISYIVSGEGMPGFTDNSDEETIRNSMASIRSERDCILSKYSASDSGKIDESALRKALLAVFTPGITDTFVGIVNNSIRYSTIIKNGVKAVLPKGFQTDYWGERLRYNRISGYFQYTGVITTDDLNELFIAFPDKEVQQQLQELYDRPERFVRDTLATIMDDPAEIEKAVGMLVQRASLRIIFDHPDRFVRNALATIMDDSAEIEKAVSLLVKETGLRTITDANLIKSVQNRLEYLFSIVSDSIRKRLLFSAIIKELSTALSTDNPLLTLLVKGKEDTLAEAAAATGLTGYYFDNAASASPFSTRSDDTIDFGFEGSAGTIPVMNTAYIVWEGLLHPPTDGEYLFTIEVGGTGESATVFIDDDKVIDTLTANAIPKKMKLSAARLYPVTIRYKKPVNSGKIRFFWQSGAFEKQIVPAKNLVPSSAWKQFRETVLICHRTVLFTGNFNLSLAEIEYFIIHKGNFRNIDFSELTFLHWETVNDYCSFKKDLPSSTVIPLDIFKFAWEMDPYTGMEQLRGMVAQLLGVNHTRIHSFFNYYNTSAADFRNAFTLRKIHTAMKFINKSGIPDDSFYRWGSVTSDFDTLADIADEIRNAIKSRLDHESWLKVAAQFNDTLRERKRRALVSYLLTRTVVNEWGAIDADSLYEYFLIDVQMQSCRTTSRIAQAISSVQLFVQRCLLNLEEPDVLPNDIDIDRWEWMKNYRVWEANRKIFLWPENWLEPELRDDKSPFFREMEAELLKNDITDRSVETALRNYLYKLNEVAYLDVCGMHQEDAEVGTENPVIIHVIARTKAAPYRYYYRKYTCNRNDHSDGVWSAWEVVDAGIQGVENVDNPGVHVMPVVWKKRLFLFWPEFSEKQKELKPYDDQSKNISGLTLNEIYNVAPTLKYWEIRLAWSEYVEGKWSQKQTSTASFSELVDFERNTMQIQLPTYTVSGGIEIEFVDYYFYTMKWWSSKITDTHLSDDLAENEKTHLQPEQYSFSVDTTGDELIISLLAVEIEVAKFQFNQNLLIHILEGNFGRIYSLGSYTLGDGVYSSINYWRPLKISYHSSICIENCLYERYHASVIYTPPIDKEHYYLTNIEPNTHARIFISDNKLNTSPEPFILLNRIFIFQDDKNAFFIPTALNEEYLLFHSFVHHYTSFFISKLNELKYNKYDFKELFYSNFSTDSDEGESFRTTYAPNNEHISTPYPTKDIDFEPHGAYSLYNWELFFHLPLYIATRLSKNGKYAEARKWFHYIFDPTTNEADDTLPPNVRYWKVKIFRERQIELNNLREGTATDPDAYTELIVSETYAQWLENPFKPHVIARNRWQAYMKHVVMKYLDNLIAWGDMLFRQETSEAINEATQLSMLASHILGPKPQFIPRRGKPKNETFDSLSGQNGDGLDLFSNAMVDFENEFPFFSGLVNENIADTGNFLGTGHMCYFCIPDNENLLKYWEIVGDRLFKIRHCRNIDGAYLNPSLWAPPIDPGLLAQAIAQGIDIATVISDINTPSSFYRFSFLMQKAMEFCSEVKSLGNTLLSLMEKRDAEELSILRAEHESVMLDLMTGIKERQLQDARVARHGLEKTRENTWKRLEHYLELLGIDKGSLQKPSTPELPADMTADSTLPSDTTVRTVVPDVDVSLTDSQERGVKLIPREAQEIGKMNEATDWQTVAGVIEMAAGLAHLIPNIEGAAKPFGIGVSATYGGSNVGSMLNALAQFFHLLGMRASHDASIAGKMAGYIRREQDWVFQANMAAREIVQIDKQITGCDIRIQIAERELENHKQQIKNAEEVEEYIRQKFTNMELYQWMREQIFLVYRQSFQLAYDLAKKAELAYRFEIGKNDTNFIQYGSWDDFRQGLTAGERLYFNLKQMEAAHLEDNKREFELTKYISIALLDPEALLALKNSGICTVRLPEELFDLDFPGQYFRKIKSVSLTIPCVAGPHTTINCTLRLMNNSIRRNTLITGSYPRNNDNGIPIDDNRFMENTIPVTAIAVSGSQNDSGMFELNFRDERYLPFEGAGVISTWSIELMRNTDLRQFDYGTISDVIMQIRFTAREDAGDFKEKAVQYLSSALADNTNTTFPFHVRIFSLRRDFPSAFAKLLNSAGESTSRADLTIGGNHFPFIFSGKMLKIDSMQLLMEMNAGQTGEPVGTLNIYTEETRTGDHPDTPDATTGTWSTYANRIWGAELFAAGSTNEVPLQKWTMEIVNTDNISKDTVHDIYLLMRCTIGS